MEALRFQLNKVKRLLKVQGQEFIFDRYKVNDFNEPTDETDSQIKLIGVYHETVSYQQKTAADGSITQSKASPMILCQWEDAEKLRTTDKLKFNDSTYIIGGIKNIGEANIIADISLEELIHG